MSWDVIGCSNCEAVWLIEREQRREQDRLSCPNCARSIDTASLSPLAHHEEYDVAAELRARILATRSGEIDRYEGMDDYGQQADDVKARSQSVTDTGDQDLRPMGSDRYEDAAQAYLEERDRRFEEQADRVLSQFDDSFAELVDVDEPVDRGRVDREAIQTDGDLKLEPSSADLTLEADAIVTQIPPTRREWLQELTEALLPTVLETVRDAAAKHLGARTPHKRQVQDLADLVLEIIGFDEIDEEDVAAEVRLWAYAFADLAVSDQFVLEDGSVQLVEEINGVPTKGDGPFAEKLERTLGEIVATGTGTGPFNADVEAWFASTAQLLEWREESVEIAVSFDPEAWINADSATRDRSLSAFSRLSEVSHLHVYPTSQQAQTMLLEDHEEWVESALDLTRSRQTSRPISDISDETIRGAWEDLRSEDLNRGHRRLLLAMVGESSRTPQALARDHAVDLAEASIYRYLEELEAVEMVDVDRSTRPHSYSLSTRGVAACSLINDDYSLRHPAQSQIGGRLTRPLQSATSTVYSPQLQDGWEDPEDWLAQTGHPEEDGYVQWMGDRDGPRQIQPPAMHRRLSAGKRVNGVNLVDDTIPNWRTREDGDGRVAYISTFDDEHLVVVQYGGAVPTLARLCSALLSQKSLSKTLSPDATGIQFSDLYGGSNPFKNRIEDVLQRGNQIGWLSNDETQHYDNWRERYREVLSEILAKTAKYQELDSGLQTQLKKDLLGLLTSLTHLYEAAGVDLQIHIRMPDVNQLIRDEERLREFLFLLRYTVTKQGYYEDHHGQHSIFRMLIENRPQKLRARLPYDIDEDDEASLTASWVITGPGISALQEEIETQLAAETSRVREPIQEGREDAARLDLPVVQSNGFGHLKQIVQDIADSKDLTVNTEEINDLVRLFQGTLASSEIPASPYDVAQAMQSLAGADRADDRLEVRDLEHGLSKLPTDRLFPELPPAAQKMISSLLGAGGSLQKEELLEIVSESSYDRHIETLLATDVVQDVGKGELLATVAPWWSPASDRHEPRGEAHESSIEAHSDGSHTAILYAAAFEIAPQVLEKNDYELFAWPVDLEEVRREIPELRFFVTMVSYYFDLIETTERVKVASIGPPRTSPDPAQTSLGVEQNRTTAD